MARRGRPVRIPGYREWIGEVTQVTAKEAATQIVGRLIFLGPWYSGQFARNWVVKVGDVRIPATVEGENRFAPEGGFKARTARQLVDLPPVPSLRPSFFCGSTEMFKRGIHTWKTLVLKYL